MCAVVAGVVVRAVSAWSIDAAGRPVTPRMAGRITPIAPRQVPEARLRTRNGTVCPVGSPSTR